MRRGLAARARSCRAAERPIGVDAMAMRFGVVIHPGTVMARGGQWVPGDAPSQVLTWAVQAQAKAGTLSVIGDRCLQDV